MNSEKSRTTGLTRALGVRVRTRRLALGMTQDRLAKELGYRDSTSVTFIEQGHNTMKPDRLLALCAILQISPNELLGWEG